MEKIILDGNSLTLDQIYEVVYDGACVEISEEALNGRKRQSMSYTGWWTRKRLFTGQTEG